jgi:anaerobic selenocysteine-containing dehydrogenase
MDDSVREIRGACPLDCPDTCSWIVTVNEGTPVALRGDSSRPYTRGSLCDKVADYLSYARYPTSGSGSGKRTVRNSRTSMRVNSPP